MAKVDSTANQRLADYRREIWRARRNTIMSMVLVACCTALLVMLASGDRFNNILAIFGLSGIYNEEGGVYADCSKPENKDSPYCQPRQPRAREWDGIKRSGGSYRPFTLYSFDEGE